MSHVLSVTGVEHYFKEASFNIILNIFIKKEDILISLILGNY